MKVGDKVLFNGEVCIITKFEKWHGDKECICVTGCDYWLDLDEVKAIE